MRPQKKKNNPIALYTYLCVINYEFDQLFLFFYDGMVEEF